MNGPSRERLRRSLALSGAVAAFLVPFGALDWLSGSAESLHRKAAVSRLLSEAGAARGSPSAAVGRPKDESVLAVFPVSGGNGRTTQAAAAGVVLALLPEGAFPIELAVGRSGEPIAGRVAPATPAYAMTALEAALAARLGEGSAAGRLPAGQGVGYPVASRAVDSAIDAFVRACVEAGLVESEDS